MSAPILTIKVTSTRLFPSGKPVSSALLEDGRTRHQLVDGRGLTVPPAHGYVIDYQSTFVNAKPGDTYPCCVSFVGLSSVPGFVETWDHDIGEVRCYAFDKIVKVTSVIEGWSVTGEELREQLGGVYRVLRG